MKVPNTCPRCADNWIPCNERPGEYPGALSRADNKTEICSACGEDEALENYYNGACTPVEGWPVNLGDSLPFNGGGKQSGVYLKVEFTGEEGEDVLARFTDQNGDRSITILTAPRNTIDGDGPVITQTSPDTICVVLSHEFVVGTIHEAVDEYDDSFGPPAASFGMAFVISKALRAVEEFLDDSV